MLVGFYYDPAKPSEAEMIEHNRAFERRQTTGVDDAALRHILRTASGRRIVAGAAQHFQPGQLFSKADLARAIGESEDSVFAWIRQLGRPETKFGMPVFEKHRGEDGQIRYSLTRPMHDAIGRANSHNENGDTA